MVIRPFDLRDIPLVRRLEGQGVSLDSRTALTEDYRPLPSALWAYLVAGRGCPTLVLRGRQSGAPLRAFGQLRVCPGRQQAHLLTLAARPEGRESLVWPQMLDALTAQAGRCGSHGVLAEVEDSGSKFELLRKAEFVVYTRQEIWALSSTPQFEGSGILRPEGPGDQWHIQQLVANTVPRLIQQIEPVDQTGLSLVWKEGGRLLACASVHQGKRGCWLRLYLHPEAEDAAPALVAETATHLSSTTEKPLYCCVRRYQEWLTRPLAELGFNPLGSQAVMVRRTVVPVARLQREFVPAHEKVLEATSPVAHASEQ